MPDRELPSRSVAVERIVECRSTVLVNAATERVALDAIAGRALAADVHAPRDVPPHDYATMDGYAAAAAGDPPLDVVDEVAPEDSPPEIDPGDAVRIATGAPLPPRADAVLKRENATVVDGRLTTWDLAAGTSVHRQGTTAEADERLFAAGERLAPDTRRSAATSGSTPFRSASGSRSGSSRPGPRSTRAASPTATPSSSPTSSGRGATSLRVLELFPTTPPPFGKRSRAWLRTTMSCSPRAARASGRRITFRAPSQVTTPCSLAFASGPAGQ